MPRWPASSSLTALSIFVPLITAAVKAGKAVLCEKPVDLDLERARACWSEIAAQQPRVMIGFNRRFDPSFRARRERLHKGEVGKLELAVITSRDPAPPPAGYIQSSGGFFPPITIPRLRHGALSRERYRRCMHSVRIWWIPPSARPATSTPAPCRCGRVGALLHINNSRRSVWLRSAHRGVRASGMLHAGNQARHLGAAWSAEHTGLRSDPPFLSRALSPGLRVGTERLRRGTGRGPSHDPGFLRRARGATAGEQPKRACAPAGRWTCRR